MSVSLPARGQHDLVRPNGGVIRHERAVDHGLPLQEILEGREDVLLVVVPLQGVVLAVRARRGGLRLRRVMRALRALRVRMRMRSRGHRAQRSVRDGLTKGRGVDVLGLVLGVVAFHHLIRLTSRR